MEQTKVYVIICKKRTTSVAKCRGSWVVGRCRGSWVWEWVNVVGEKMSSKKNEKNEKAKSCKNLRVHTSPIPLPRGQQKK